MQHLYLSHPRHRQHGVALFVVIVFVMLSMLLTLWASRTSLFNEMVVGNDADYQRAFAAAQALQQDAELDIRGENANGTACTKNPGQPKVCRSAANIAQIPLEAQEVGLLLADLSTTTEKCKNGLCIKRTGKQDFWDNADQSLGLTLAQMTGVGARYGEYTGAQLGNTSSPANPILAETAADRGGWYWIEVLPYDESSKNSGLIVGGPTNFLPLNLLPNVVYRITALAYGRKPSTMVVLQQTYVRQKLKD